ncbi:hypothetical protein K491DRAFT_773378 [Lophiostoma macrostomum CBS 122681]|uniref:Uncharacterized protein n=1 Tax=Lophiostoma macrostomum CBS 122681 TaxID=1314788 RepID=A0A6A6TR22_9PLEO|nr:hypothetical protein K491DRAFT_773378 [Lophiostoma macrostomum CBS 122681]
MESLQLFDIPTRLRQNLSISVVILALAVFLIGAVQKTLRKRKTSGPLFLNKKSVSPENDDPFNLKQIIPYDGIPLSHPPDWPRYWKSGKYQLTMALRKLDMNNWMTFDNQWLTEHNKKREYCRLPNKRDIVDYLDGDDDIAVLELLDLVVNYVTLRYPDMFSLEADYIRIKPTDEIYRAKAPLDQPPMELIGLLVMDDMYILKQGTRNLYYLRGAFLACPTAWKLSDRIGWPIYQIHGAVPLWKERLQKSMEKYFVNLKVSQPIQRNNLFVQPCGGLFHWDDFATYPVVHQPEGVFLRTELQSLRRLPKSGAVVFSVRTYVTPLMDLAKEPEALERLWAHVRSFPEDVAKHKVRHLWGDTFEKFCKEILGREDPEIDPETGDGVGLKKVCPAGFA